MADKITLLQAVDILLGLQKKPQLSNRGIINNPTKILSNSPQSNSAFKKTIKKLNFPTLLPSRPHFLHND